MRKLVCRWGPDALASPPQNISETPANLPLAKWVEGTTSNKKKEKFVFVFAPIQIILELRRSLDVAVTTPFKLDYLV